MTVIRSAFGIEPEYHPREKRQEMTEIVAVALVDAGLAAALMGAVSLLKTLSFLGIHNRQNAALVLGFGFLLVGMGWILPAKEVRIAASRTHLDEFAPAYQFNEIHSIRVNASRNQVYRAIKGVTADEMRLFRTLIWIRRFGQPGPENILNAPEKVPLLEVATRTTFLLLAEEPDREIVIGTVVLVPRGWQPKGKATPHNFQAMHAPGFALASMNFLVEDAGPGVCLVTTETRVYATDPSAARKFARYWRLIYPGSALIRRMWLRAIKQRAESTNPQP